MLPPNLAVIAVLLLLAELGLWLYMGPLNALIANVVPVRMRTRAYAVSILASHALGDAIR